MPRMMLRSCSALLYLSAGAVVAVTVLVAAYVLGAQQCSTQHAAPDWLPSTAARQWLSSKTLAAVPPVANAAQGTLTDPDIAPQFGAAAAPVGAGPLAAKPVPPDIANLVIPSAASGPIPPAVNSPTAAGHSPPGSNPATPLGALAPLAGPNPVAGDLAIYESAVRAQEALRRAHASLHRPSNTTLWQPGNHGDKVSVVLMNWARPNNTRAILEALVGYKLVGEVIVFMERRDTAFDFWHPKVRVFNDELGNALWGLSTRFKGCQLAAHEWVLTQDDDLVVPEATLAALVVAKKQDPNRLLGVMGRDWKKPMPHYSGLEYWSGSHRIVLTRCLLMDRRFCDAFFVYSPLLEDVVRDSRPYWNGEDIFMSFVSYKVTGNKPFIVRASVKEMAMKELGISKTAPGHKTHRTRVVRETIKRLGITEWWPQNATT